MKDLISRLTVASEPSRELDALAWNAIDPRPLEECGSGWGKRDPEDTIAFDLPPQFTASLDAARLLKREGWSWGVEWDAEASRARAWTRGQDGAVFEGEGSTEEIAACVAFLASRTDDAEASPENEPYRLKCDLDCANYDGAIEDCNQAVRQMIRLLNGETTPERTREWVRLNYPALAPLCRVATETGGQAQVIRRVARAIERNRVGCAPYWTEEQFDAWCEKNPIGRKSFAEASDQAEQALAALRPGDEIGPCVLLPQGEATGPGKPSAPGQEDGSSDG